MDRSTFFVFACLAAIAIASGPLATSSAAETLSVPGKANIFGAGHRNAPAPGGGGAGVLPPFVRLAAGPNQVVTFSSVTGRVSCCGGSAPLNGPDGSPGETSIRGHGGIAGIQASSRIFLAGVFVDDAEPADPAPAALSFASTSFTELSPQLRQTFFIGDGRAGATAQRFRVPPRATRLYLGFVDASGFGGAPGYYDDNRGELKVVLAISRERAPVTVVALAFVRADGSGPLAQLQYGELFRLEARFSAPPPESERLVKIEWPGGVRDIPVFRQPEGTLFRSDPLRLEPPAPGPTGG
jgi:hypothetical protein